MPRPRKCRKVCCLPINDGFLPVRGEKGQQPVILKVDEYEALRLIDREGFSQEECGDYMHIARATVQQIYTSARKKLADVLVEGRPLLIAGGEYRLCDGTESGCACKGCHKRRCPTVRTEAKSGNNSKEGSDEDCHSIKQMSAWCLPAHRSSCFGRMGSRLSQKILPLRHRAEPVSRQRSFWWTAQRTC